MTKPQLTPEQKAASKALKIQAAADARLKAQFEKEAAVAKYKAELPKRMMEAQALAHRVGVSASVELTEIGPQIAFHCDNDADKWYIDEVIGYDTEEWELEYLENKLKTIKDTQDAREARRAFAQSTFSNLTDEQKACIKEFINFLK